MSSVYTPRIRYVALLSALKDTLFEPIAVRLIDRESDRIERALKAEEVRKALPPVVHRKRRKRGPDIDWSVVTGDPVGVMIETMRMKQMLKAARDREKAT